MWTTRDARRLLSSSSAATEVIPTTPPAALKTGPPAVPDATLKSAMMECGSTRLMVPDVMTFWPRSGVPIAKSSCFATTGGLAADEQPSGTAALMRRPPD